MTANPLKSKYFQHRLHCKCDAHLKREEKRDAFYFTEITLANVLDTQHCIFNAFLWLLMCKLKYELLTNHEEEIAF